MKKIIGLKKISVAVENRVIKQKQCQDMPGIYRKKSCTQRIQSFQTNPKLLNGNWYVVKMFLVFRIAPGFKIHPFNHDRMVLKFIWKNNVVSIDRRRDLLYSKLIYIKAVIPIYRLKFQSKHL